MSPGLEDLAKGCSGKGLEVTNCMDLAKDPTVLTYIRAWVLIQDGLGGVALCFSVAGVRAFCCRAWFKPLTLRVLELQIRDLGFPIMGVKITMYGLAARLEHSLTRGFGLLRFITLVTLS